MDQFRFAGYRVIEFPPASRIALREIAERLVPHQDEIVERWIELQFSAWQPPGRSREQLRGLFGELFRRILGCMECGGLEGCIGDLEETGAELARSDFPYEALIVSLHFLEESYMPFLLNPRSAKTQEWLIRIDEFLHVGIAALATSYFEFYRSQLMAEAEVGRVVQEALSPHLPKRIGDLELGFVYASASERSRLGGDLLDVFSFGDGQIGFAVGDLSGHGLEAAAGSTTIRNLFRGFMRDGSDLVDAVGRLNRVLTEELEAVQFATLVAGAYTSPGRLTLVNAGGPPPIICGGACRGTRHTNFPLAIDLDVTYALDEVDLSPGNILVAYTDGLSEARVGSDLFGEARVVDAVNEMRDAPARAIAEHLKDSAMRHANGRLMDDMAILVMRRLV